MEIATACWQRRHPGHFSPAWCQWKPDTPQYHTDIINSGQKSAVLSIGQVLKYNECLHGKVVTKIGSCNSASKRSAVRCHHRI